MGFARSLLPREYSRAQIALRVSLKTILLGYVAAALAVAVTAANAQNLRVAPVFAWTSAFSLDLNILVPEGSTLPATQFPTYQACDAGQRSSAAQAILESPPGCFIMNPLIYPLYGPRTNSVDGLYTASGFTVSKLDCYGVTGVGTVTPAYSCNLGLLCPANGSGPRFASMQAPTATQGAIAVGAFCDTTEPDCDNCNPDSNIGNPIDIGSKVKTATDTDLPLLGALSTFRSFDLSILQE